MNKYFLVLILLIFSSLSHTEDNDQSLQIQALFIYNFSNFVEWPNNAFSDNSAPLKVCLFGTVLFYDFLNFFNGTIVKDRRLDISNTNNRNDIKSGCHILFVGNDKKHNLPELFKNIEHSFVLSIGNTKNFSNIGGVINIMRTYDQVEFEININQALKNKLYITSDLLSLARAIHEN